MTDAANKREEQRNPVSVHDDGVRDPLPDAARRALEEAVQRRRKAQSTRPVEIGGRGGLEPTRYGDWEVKGLTSDF